MVSPRRSSRARSTAHPVTASSSSSASSSRNRHTRHRTEEETHADLDANFQRGLDADLDDTNDSNSNADEVMDDADDQENEITRCICGYQDYQGGEDDQSDTDGLFIQCDQCKVWQHGFCVGITDGDSTPDNYYCEKCKPELHKEGYNKAGLKTSIYLPARDEPPKPSKNAKDMNHKRRTTMNSRDAEYDDEVLKRMLEVSKQETKANPDSSVRNSRGRKRGSSEGSDDPKGSKRSRTSDSPDSPSNVAVESGDEKPMTTAPSSSRKARGTTRNTSSQNTSNKRTSARNRGAEKVEPRKDDSEHSDDYAPRKNNRSAHRNSVEEPSVSPPSIPEQVPDTQQQATKRAARGNNNSSANGGRRRNGRHVRQSEDPNDIETSVFRVESSAGHGKHETPASILEKPTKPRIPPSRISVNEMKKRVNNISEYITRTQVEMANTRQSDIYAYLAWMEEKGTPVSKSSTATPKTPWNAGSPHSIHNGSSSSDSNIPKIQINGGNGSGTGNVLEKASEALSGNLNAGALEIMEMLSTKINRWQQHYGEVL